MPLGSRLIVNSKKTHKKPTFFRLRDQTAPTYPALSPKPRSNWMFAVLLQHADFRLRVSNSMIQQSASELSPSFPNTTSPPSLPLSFSAIPPFSISPHLFIAPFARSRNHTIRSIPISRENSTFDSSSMDAQIPADQFLDMLPVMAEKLGGEALIGELCKGFQLLMDRDRGVITFESLKRNSSAVLGLQDLSDEELRSMVSEGDFDGDGALNQMEFCVLMFRLSPQLMDQSWSLLQEVLEREFLFC